MGGGAESLQKEKKKRRGGRWTKTTNKGGHGFAERGEESAVSETWRKIRSEGGGEERGEGGERRPGWRLGVEQVGRRH